MAGSNLELIELWLVILFLNLNKHAKKENGQEENTQKKNMFENDDKKDTFDEGCTTHDDKKDAFDEDCTSHDDTEDKPDDDSSFEFQQKSNMIPTTLDKNEQPNMVPATLDVSRKPNMIPTTLDKIGQPNMIPTKLNENGKPNIVATNLDRYGQHNIVATNLDRYGQHNMVPTNLDRYGQPNIVPTKLEENSTPNMIPTKLEDMVPTNKDITGKLNLLPNPIDITGKLNSVPNPMEISGKLNSVQQLSPYSVPTFHTSVKIIIFTSLLAILTNNSSPKALLHNTAYNMSASSLTTQQEIFLADTNMVNKHGSDEKPNRWREMSYEYSSLSKHPPKLAKLHWRPIPPHCLRSTMWKDLPKVTETLFTIKEETKKQSLVYEEKVDDQEVLNIVTNHKLDLIVIFKIICMEKFLSFNKPKAIVQDMDDKISTSKDIEKLQSLTQADDEIYAHERKATELDAS